MANRCAYKDRGRRCSRNGFGNPPLCRAHAIALSVDGRSVEMPEDSPFFNILDLADRALSRSKNDFARQVGEIFGEVLSQAAAQNSARQQQPRYEHQAPPRTPPPPPEPVKEDPRVVLGFEPGEALTAARVKERKRQLAALFHPDKQGGSISAMKRVNEAADALLKTL